MPKIVRASWLALGAWVASAGVPALAWEQGGQGLSIPAVAPGPHRLINTADLAALRDIDSLTLSPDGQRYAILVRQSDVAANDYRTAWFVGPSSGGTLTFVGSGGQARLRESPDGRTTGYIVGSPARWSPDSRWIAYWRSTNGEIQVWVSSADGRVQRQVTHSAADVRDFAWSEDGRSLYFTAGTPRQTLIAREEAGSRNGYLLDDFQFTGEIVYQARPNRPLETALTVWVAGAEGGEAHIASNAESAAFERAKARNYSWGRSQRQGTTAAEIGGAAAPPIAAPNGSLVWMERVDRASNDVLPVLRLRASRHSDGSDPIVCNAPECSGQIFSKLWWSADASQVIFWRKEDTNLVENSFYAWTPASGAVRRLFHNDGDEFKECELAGARLICARQMLDRPDHIAAIDLRTGAVDVLADLNPEFRNIDLARVERFTWETPADTHHLGYERSMFGYILYPPNFNPHSRYPVFIAPYGAPGFRRGDVGDEQPLFVYAAAGFVVISSQFPVPLVGMTRPMTEFYSPEHGFPHLTMLADSTFRALDTVAARGFVDESRVGIGGLSHGSFVPLFMLQKHDRLSAVSIAGPGWQQFEYYSSTRTGRAYTPSVNAWPESPEFWTQIDIADHVEEIEAPLLVNYPDREFFHDWRLSRRMENAGRAFEAHIFADEHHVKWQPAHRYSIYNRNLDWFRFWLQDYEDPDPAKAEQYARWRQLRELQCHNPRSLRNYCGMQH